MELEPTARGREISKLAAEFVREHVYPAESVFKEQIETSGDPHHHPQVIEELKQEARRQGLWNMFHAKAEWGAGLSNLDYAYVAEELGRSRIASEACNCSAPDTGNMEILELFGTDEQKQLWLEPLTDGRIRSGFAMTEPGVASSDATNVGLRIERDGDSYILNGRKWWTSGAMSSRCAVLIVMGKTDPSAAPHRQQSQILVPVDEPGVTVVRNLTVFGFQDQEGHAEVTFENVRVPVSSILHGEGEGFAISQARLGPGRIHHCMRLLGAAERSLELMCERALSRTTFGRRLAERSNIQDWIAESRVEIDMVRLLCLKAAWLMDTVGNRAARTEISAIKIAAPAMASRVIDRAMQVFGGGGLGPDTPMARMYVAARALRIADGPDEVHKMTIARRELRQYDTTFGTAAR